MVCIGVFYFEVSERKKTTVKTTEVMQVHPAPSGRHGWWCGSPVGLWALYGVSDEVGVAGGWVRASRRGRWRLAVDSKGASILLIVQIIECIQLRGQPHGGAASGTALLGESVRHVQNTTLPS